jgi:hypothetical protein
LGSVPNEYGLNLVEMPDSLRPVVSEEDFKKYAVIINLKMVSDETLFELKEASPDRLEE